MGSLKKLVLFIRRWRGRVRRLQRIIFMSPAEARFVQLMGGKIITIQRLKHYKTGFPVTIVLSLGKTLRGERFKREVRMGKFFVDFANDLNRVIEIDGDPYHMDVVADMDREIYITDFCRQFFPNREVRFMRIPAYRLWNDRNRVQQEALRFIRDGRIK